MKTKSVSESAFVNLSSLIGRLLCSIVVLLALIGFVAFPSSSAQASQGQCGDVSIGWEYGQTDDLYYELMVAPTTCIIYVTQNEDTGYPADPSWNHQTGVPNAGTSAVSSGAEIHIRLGHTLFIKARAHKVNWTESVNLSMDEQHNPNGF